MTVIIKAGDREATELINSLPKHDIFSGMNDTIPNAYVFVDVREDRLVIALSPPIYGMLDVKLDNINGDVAPFCS